MRRRTFKATAIGVACAALVAIVVAGCGSSSSSSTPGLTSTSITFGTHQPLTGPAAPGYSEIAPASQAFFNYLNAQGGINGRKINLIYKNDEYNPAKTAAARSRAAPRGLESLARGGDRPGSADAATRTAPAQAFSAPAADPGGR